ncbi:MAG: GNAT family N-acetyltransferase [Clostridia bacterium]|nr:GNAT family N-acetyltransferase [Clostridia bacterium]
MAYILEDTKKVESLFEGWEETLIYSCLQKVMGKIYVDNLEEPESACAKIGDLAFFAGKPDENLIKESINRFTIIVPQSDLWNVSIEKVFPEAKKSVRYAIKKNTVFDKEKLKAFASNIPDGYELSEINGEVYDKCFGNPVTEDFVSCFGSKENYLKLGRGVVLLKDGKIVAGASSYTRYNEGIEIEVDTEPEYRQKGLATIASAKLILNCLEEGLYPSWDAANMTSVRLAEKLGYEFSHEYTMYEVNSAGRTH